MGIEDEVLGLERDGWVALSSGGEAAATFYGEVLADEVCFLLPGGMVIDDRAELVRSMQDAPWTSFEFADERVLVLGDASAVVAYRATAQRDGGSYTALFTSSYRRVDGRWRLVVHQQTPV
ncbi:nuclear transport factor 2 family protein [Rhabdothermincola salaria]|uniref:nuclear transport factor 2 family protein n=1 Tax=Rhabdothermincola salaria TaxID=2903142 RepID=UPI001E2E447D|nr:nuclear transport factor 2 family protein [Rhabdothermincola salaria]MCD9623973.1 nuclear transport factor 2 family protein [Rhabdothermincola salaria]